MLIEEEKKEELIKKLNINFRTILSYGNDQLVPMGEFIITDIIEDDIPEEYTSKKSEFEFTNIILTKIDDEEVQIILPITAFLTKYATLSEINADKLGLGADLAKTIDGVKEKAESRVFFDETLDDVAKAETISLEEIEADYLINGEMQSSNYSICPINLGVYRERIREGIERKDKKSTDAKKLEIFKKIETNEEKELGLIQENEKLDYERE